MEDAIVRAFFKICMYVGLGAGICLLLMIFWVYVIVPIPGCLKNHLTRPYDPEKDYKNPLRR